MLPTLVITLTWAAARASMLHMLPGDHPCQVHLRSGARFDAASAACCGRRSLEPNEPCAAVPFLNIQP